MLSVETIAAFNGNTERNPLPTRTQGSLRRPCQMQPLFARRPQILERRYSLGTLSFGFGIAMVNLAFATCNHAVYSL
ncbi:hypothetical protein EVAR_48343_1 [Eumeta japonica]|uniref:Uncharacterized protein n=1 Tax=Eumeta variegata TaxID=151549 RepID=A0A4C1WK73_EUMVA|nr:hypothetical protein EVAR_48343_1 [Eumeta japonica]